MRSRLSGSGVPWLEPGPAFLIFFSAVLLLFVLAILRPLLAPVVLGGLAAVVLGPVHQRLERRLGAARNLAALTSVALFAVCVGVPLATAAMVVVAQARGVVEEIVGMPAGIDLTSRLAQLLDQFLRWLDELSASYLGQTVDLEQIARERLQAVGSALYGALPGALEWLARLLVAAVVFSVVLFFLLRDGARVRRLLVELSPLEQRHTTKILMRLEETIRAVFLGGVLTALFQGSIGGFGFWAAGFANFAIWGTMIFIASFLPLVGTALIWGPAVVYLGLTGEGGHALLLLVFGIVISTTDNVLRVLLIGGRTAIHPLLLFLGAFGGLAAMGPMGLVYGLLLIAVVSEAIDIYREDFAPTLPPEAPEP